MGYLVMEDGGGNCLETNTEYEKRTKLSFPWRGPGCQRPSLLGDVNF